MNLVSERWGWAAIEESPMHWLTICPDGDFTICDVAFTQEDGVSCAAGTVRVVKAAGEGTTLTLTSGQGRTTLQYAHGQWYHWQRQEAASVPAPASKAATSSAVAAPLAAVPATPVPSPRSWSCGGLGAPRVLLTLLAIGFIASLTPAANWLKVFWFDETTWLRLGGLHTLVTHSLMHVRAAELAYCGAGVLLFGWLVQRNVGFWRTLALFAWSAAFSIGFWQFLNTPLGEAVLRDLVAKAFDYLAEHHGPGGAAAVFGWYLQTYQQLRELHGPVCGAAGAVSGLMTFALFRRSFHASRWPVKWLTLAALVAYLSVGWQWVWPSLLHEPAPYLLFVGGGLGGWIFCFPDKALHHFGDSLRNALKELQEKKDESV